MSKSERPVNPCYVLLVAIGIAFTVTACAYGVMAFRAVRSADEATGLAAFMDRYGARLMTAELSLLAAATLAAIGLDHVRGRRAPPAEPPGTRPRNDQGRSPNDERRPKPE